MKRPTLSIISAIDEKGGIGKRNSLPWYLPEDLKRFKKLTTGHTVIMGRKTYQSIFDRLGKPLPNRVNIAISKNRQFKPEGVTVFWSVEDAIDYAFRIEKEEIFIIGGATIYDQTVNRVDKLYITQVKGDHQADVFFPKIDWSAWQEIEQEDFPTHSFVTYVKPLK